MLSLKKFLKGGILVSLLIFVAQAQETKKEKTKGKEVVQEKFYIDGTKNQPMKAPATLENKVASKTVLSGEEATLQAAYTLDDLFERVPNVIDNGSTFGLFIIRGVENTNGTFTVGSTSQSAPVIVDGVPLSTFAAGYFRPIT